MQVEVVSALWPYVTKALVGLLIAGIGAAFMWPIRKARKEWVSLKDTTQAIQNELAQQRTNCLTTLQQQGEKQIELLSKAADTLDGVRLDLAEQTGYLRASSAPACRVRAKKKT